MSWDFLDLELEEIPRRVVACPKYLISLTCNFRNTHNIDFRISHRNYIFQFFFAKIFGGNRRNKEEKNYFLVLSQ